MSQGAKNLFGGGRQKGGGVPRSRKRGSCRGGSEKTMSSLEAAMGPGEPGGGVSLIEGENHEKMKRL